MTNKEALIAAVGFTVPDNMIEKAMIDNEVTGTNTYTIDDAESIDLCVIPILQWALSQPNVSEGGYSLSFNREAVQARLDTLLEDNELSSMSSVRGKSVW